MRYFWSAFSLLLILSCSDPKPAELVVTHTWDPKTQALEFFWKNDSAMPIRSMARLQQYLKRKKQRLVFAMNGGMYEENGDPVGLFIHNQKTIAPLNTATGKGNFYLEPSGVFYTTKNKSAVICSTNEFKFDSSVLNATQSGPMLVHKGKIHPAFRRDSQNKTIRNGVGILDNGTIIFAITTGPISFYDFAAYFKGLGCQNALFLDGTVSRMYDPEHDMEPQDGDFGVILGITEKSNR
jgi:uncharacterized protein YigE (DUF2233 family)